MNSLYGTKAIVEATMDLKYDMKPIVRKHLDLGIKEINAERREIKFVASQELVDRDGDLIVADGIDVSNFSRNAVLLADHDRTFVLGKVTSLRVEPRAEGRALIGVAEILPAGTSGRVDEAYGAIRFGARNGISIGFIPIHVDGPVREGQHGRTFSRIQLIEISSVSLPSCPTCVIEEKRWHARSNFSGEAFEVDESILDAVLTKTVAYALVETTKEAVMAAINAQRGRVD